MTKIRKVSPDNPNGITRDMTPEEQASYDADVANANKNILVDGNTTTQYGIDEDYETAKADKEAKDAIKASAKAKLIAGEALTEDEANTIVI